MLHRIAATFLLGAAAACGHSVQTAPGPLVQMDPHFTVQTAEWAEDTVIRYFMRRYNIDGLVGVCVAVEVERGARPNADQLIDEVLSASRINVGGLTAMYGLGDGEVPVSWDGPPSAAQCVRTDLRWGAHGEDSRARIHARYPTTLKLAREAAPNN